MNVRNMLMCLLSFCLFFSMSRVALAVDPYSFDRMWSSATWSVNSPDGVAKDSAGNLYVASGTDHRILKISSTGKILSQWGSLGTGNGQFNKPKNVAVDSGGNVYVADSLNNRIQKFDANGTYLTQWNASDSPSTLSKPTGVALDSADSVYVTEAGGSSRVLKFTPSGAYIDKVGTGIQGSGDGQFWSPSGVAVDSSGYIYVADSFNNRIQKFAADGSYLSQWNLTNSGKLDFPLAVAVDSAGNVYVTDDTDFNNPIYRIQKYNSSGTWLTRLTTPSTLLNYPNALAVDSARNLYIADTFNNRIAKFNSNGNYQTPDITGNSIIIINPSSVAVDGTGKYVYIADYTNLKNSILKYALDGTFQTTWGTTGTGNGQFNFANGSGVAVDASGNVYVADTGNNRIQKFAADGTFIAKWGTQGSDNSQFDMPSGVAVDASGNVYVADTNNCRIQKFSATGTLITQWFTYDSNNNVDFITPIGVAVDTAGNVYVVYRDVNLSIVQKFTDSGGYVAQWGGGSKFCRWPVHFTPRGGSGQRGLRLRGRYGQLSHPEIRGGWHTPRCLGHKGDNSASAARSVFRTLWCGR